MNYSSPCAGRLRHAAAGALILIAGAAFAPAAHADDTAAKVAITRAEAKIDLISRETPAATQLASFSRAHDKLEQARNAVRLGHNQQGEWLANEAELASDATAGAAQLAQMEHTRSELGHAVDVLQSELATK